MVIWCKGTGANFAFFFWGLSSSTGRQPQPALPRVQFTMCWCVSGSKTRIPSHVSTPWVIPLSHCYSIRNATPVPRCPSLKHLSRPCSSVTSAKKPSQI